MYVLFVSNCEHKAWQRTKQVLDRYATRLGDRVWGTPITMAALEEVHAALRRVASRHTSVACYQRDAVLGMRMVWLVGNARNYDKEGRFVVGYRERARTFPQYLRWAALCARLAGFGHDLGKMSKLFQSKLRYKRPSQSMQRDPVRHEWISAHLFKALTNRIDDRGWAFSDVNRAWGALTTVQIGEVPVADIQGLLDVVPWIMATHHGAMGGIWTPANKLVLDGCLHVRGTPTEENVSLFEGKCKDHEDVKRWDALLARMGRLTARLQAITCENPLVLEKVLLVARACMVLADHKVSSGTYPGGATADKGIAYANTKKSNGVRRLDQPLSWHLLEVGDLASKNTRMFSGDLPYLSRGVVSRILGKRSEDPRYVWQDRAADAVAGLEGGKLIFNVASTGAGKTLGNLKMALAMRPDEPRLAVAFNLRTLTKQTFDAYRRAIVQPGDDAFKREFARDFACLLGFHPSDKDNPMEDDEESADQQLEFELDGADDLSHPSWLQDIATRHAKDRLAALVAVPALISTMDWIVASGEPGEQERHALALIRVATSDLILDEVDSYDVEAAVAVMRVVRMAAMFGRNVIVSSATLSPAFADGLVRAYESGWRAQGTSAAWNMVIVHDDNGFEPVVVKEPSVSNANNLYRENMKRISSLIASRLAVRRLEVCAVESLDGFHEAILRKAMEMHERHAHRPPGLECRLSIGLVRVANIKPCMEIAEYLRSSGNFYVCAYHANDILERRKWREQIMDGILCRKPDNDWVKALLDSHPWIAEQRGDVRLVVVATPVEEVGRDHDFDWAIIEPSSMHSIIQTAGRVNRHRQIAVEDANVAILSRNKRALKGATKCFVSPGFECETPDGGTTHPEHDMRDLLRTEDGGHRVDVVDAGLVFDEGGRKTRFAIYDEHGILVKTSSARMILDGSLPLGFMLERFAQAYRLREGPPQEFVRIFLADGKFRRIGTRDSHAELHNSGKVSIESVPDMTWLCPEMGAVNQEGGAVHAALDTSSMVDRIVVRWHGLDTETLI